MDFGWQDIAAVMVVAWAALYLARRLWQALARRQRAGCGGCAACPGGGQTHGPGIVASQRLSASARHVQARQANESP
jgi:hypothetical protein